MADSFLDIFLDDFVEEEQDNPDDDPLGLHCDDDQQEDETSQGDCVDSATRAGAPVAKRSKRILKKKEKEDIVAHLESISEDEVFDSIQGKVIGQLHMHVYGDRLALFKELCSAYASRLKSMCHHLTELFVATYMECDKGKDKYARFQVRWHESTARFLLEPTNTSSSPSGSHIIWDHVSTSASLESKNAVMIAIVSSVYDHLLHVVLQYARTLSSVCESQSSTCTTEMNPEPDETYYRFGGGALADMLHLRYKKMKNKTCTNKDKVSREIQVLKWIQMEDADKEKLPESLKYRDRGHMYFPCAKVIPFIKELDEHVRTKANVTEYSRLGKDLVEVNMHVCVLTFLLC